MKINFGSSDRFAPTIPDAYLWCGWYPRTELRGREEIVAGEVMIGLQDADTRPVTSMPAITQCSVCEVVWN